jgi:hypothetical protein
MSLKKEAPKKGKHAPRGKAAELAAWLGRESPAAIGDWEWDQLQAWLAPISENYLRRLLRESGAPLAPWIEGVRQESLDTLEASLMKLLEGYERGDREQRGRARRAVITAKDHARWALRRQTEEDKKRDKQEMILWMTIWLENPPLFKQWAPLRRAALSRQCNPGNSISTA